MRKSSALVTEETYIKVHNRASSTVFCTCYLPVISLLWLSSFVNPVSVLVLCCYQTCVVSPIQNPHHTPMSDCFLRCYWCILLNSVWVDICLPTIVLCRSFYSCPAEPSVRPSVHCADGPVVFNGVVSGRIFWGCKFKLIFNHRNLFENYLSFVPDDAAWTEALYFLVKYYHYYPCILREIS
jgi:hypothetical protein